MEQLYLKIEELLKEIKSIRYIDLDTGQLQEENPPISYPCALIQIDIPSCEDIETRTQQVQAYFKVQIVTKTIGETNSLVPKKVREKSLEWLRLQDEVYKKLQGYSDENFYSFSRKSGRNENLRKGLRIFALQFETSWHDYTASS